MELNTHINSMVSDVSKLVCNHIEKIVFKVAEEKKDLETSILLIKSLPFVRKLVKENEILKKENKMLRERGCSTKIKIEDEKESIKLEIRDIHTNNISDEEILNEIKNIALEKPCINIDKLNQGFLEKHGLNHSFINKEEDEHWSVKKADSDSIKKIMEVDDTDVAKTILNAQKAGEYATIDTDSEEDTTTDIEEEEDLEMKAKKIQDKEDEEAKEDEDEDEEDEDEEDEDEEEEDEEEDEDDEDEDDEDEDEEDEEEEDEDDGSDEEVDEVEIDGVNYYTNNKESGNIYEVLENGDPGDKIGCYERGIAFFS
jgi:cobalamin biosynthesis protein CobT